MAIELADIHPEIIKAHRMSLRADHLASNYLDQWTKARATKANRVLNAKVRKHFPNLTASEMIALHTTLCQHVRWEDDEAAA